MIILDRGLVLGDSRRFEGIGVPFKLQQEPIHRITQREISRPPMGNGIPPSRTIRTTKAIGTGCRLPLQGNFFLF